MTNLLSSAEKLKLCTQTLARCLYWLKYDLHCGYGERAKECCIDIVETLQAIDPHMLDEIKEKVKRSFEGVDTNANRD